MTEPTPASFARVLYPSERRYFDAVAAEARAWITDGWPTDEAIDGAFGLVDPLDYLSPHASPAYTDGSAPRTSERDYVRWLVAR